MGPPDHHPGRRGRPRRRRCPSTSRPTASPASSRPSASWPVPPKPWPRGEGPVAIDAERASGYRYGQRAYLVQVRREGAGTWLIDPMGCPDLTPLDDAIGAAEWILHAATQDLACLAEVGLRPRQLFDTELAGRILGLPRVGPRRRRRALPRAQPGQGALRRRLVHPPAARAVAALRGARRRGARRAAQPHGRGPRPRRARTSGPARSSARCSAGRPPSGSTPGGARRA